MGITLVANYRSLVSEIVSGRLALPTPTITAQGCHIPPPHTPRGRGYGVVNHTPLGMFRVKVHLHTIAWFYANRDRVNWDAVAGMMVCHKCANKPCYNPAHLYLGDASQNALDASRDGQHGRRKLADGDVRAIRKRLADGQRQADVAAAFGVHKSTIGLIARGKTYGWLK